MKNIFNVFLLFMASILTTIAQSDSILIEDILIKEQRIEIPFSDVSRFLEIVDKEAIENLNPRSLNEVLQLVGGVDIRQRGAHGVQADLSIRGGSFEQALVLLNGVKLVDPQTGHHMMNIPINPEDIERIEVLKGPGARMYGQNAFAGAINIVTKNDQKKSGSIFVEAGDNQLLNAGFRAIIPHKIIDSRFSYSFSSANNHHTPERFRDNTDYQIHNAYYQGSKEISNGQLQVQGGYADRAFGGNGFYGRESFTDQYETVKTGFLSGDYTKQIGGFKILSRLAWRRNKDNWMFLRDDPEFFQNFHTTDVYSGGIHGSYTNSLGILGVGIEYDKLSIESSNLDTFKRNQIGLHLEQRFLLLDEKLDLTPGVYVVNLTDYDTQVYPGLDVGYEVNPSFKVFLSSGFTSRIPTYTDLYYEDSGSVGNPDLREETAFTTELGIKWNKENLFIQSSIFSRMASDQIDWFKLNEDDRWMPDNFSNTTYQGIDVSIKYRYNDLIKNIGFNYTFLDASFEDNDFAFSRNILENLKHQLVVSCNIELIENLNVFSLLKYNDRVSLDNYFTLDANINYNFRGYNFFVKGINLTNELYRESNLVVMPGRWVSGGVNINL